MDRSPDEEGGRVDDLLLAAARSAQERELSQRATHIEQEADERQRAEARQRQVKRVGRMVPRFLELLGPGGARGHERFVRGSRHRSVPGWRLAERHGKWVNRLGAHFDYWLALLADGEWWLVSRYGEGTLGAKKYGAGNLVLVERTSLAKEGHCPYAPIEDDGWASGPPGPLDEAVVGSMGYWLARFNCVPLPRD